MDIRDKIMSIIIKTINGDKTSWCLSQPVDIFLSVIVRFGFMLRCCIYHEILLSLKCDLDIRIVRISPYD